MRQGISPVIEVGLAVEVDLAMVMIEVGVSLAAVVVVILLLSELVVAAKDLAQLDGKYSHLDQNIR